MKEATLEDLRERYRQLPVEELLMIAADSQGLTSAAAAALEAELRVRNLSQRDIDGTRIRVEQWRSEEGKSRPRLLPRRDQFVQACIQALMLLISGVLCLATGAIMRTIGAAEETTLRVQEGMIAICFASYVAWQVAKCIRNVVRKKE